MPSTDPFPKDDRGLGFCCNKCWTYHRPEFRWVVHAVSGGSTWNILKDRGYLVAYDGAGTYSGPCRWEGAHVVHDGKQYFGGWGTFDGTNPYNTIIGLVFQCETTLKDIAFREMGFPDPWSSATLHLPRWFDNVEPGTPDESPSEILLTPIPYWDDVTRRFPDVL